jgi:hypothetical protein
VARLQEIRTAHSLRFVALFASEETVDCTSSTIFDQLGMRNYGLEPFLDLQRVEIGIGQRQEGAADPGTSAAAAAARN